MERKKLSAAEIEKSLNDLNNWKVEDNNLKKRYSFANFAESLAFVNQVGAIAEKQDHHPDITFGWSYAEIYLTTHDRGGITIRDIAVAKEIEALSN